MAPARRNPNRDEETIRSLCTEILNRIKTEGDLDALTEYRSYIRKNVPFFMRSYFAAYLFMELHRAVPPKSAQPQGGGRKARGAEKSSPRQESPRAAVTQARPEPVPSRGEVSQEKRPRPEGSPRNDPPRTALPDADAARLFFGAGRNRRAYARDLLAFIEQGAGVSADVVGEIRVLDNFSFVQVRKERADDVIAALNGAEFRGRSVTVSYAKPKKDESAPPTEAAEPPLEEAHVSDGKGDDYEVTEASSAVEFSSPEPVEAETSSIEEESTEEEPR